MQKEQNTQTKWDFEEPKLDEGLKYQVSRTDMT